MMNNYDDRDPLLATEHRFGKDRRRFIIISVFDLCLNILLWLICTVSKGDNWREEFVQEFNLFEAHFLNVSLFDVVLLAFSRMCFLIGFYAVCKVGTWIPVAVSTTISTLYLTMKVMLFFSKAQGGLPQYFLVMSAFSISWFELWLMPFRVLPRERALERQQSANLGNVGSQSVIRVRDAPVVNLFSEGEFHSAVDFSSGSEDENAQRRGVTPRYNKRRIGEEHRAEYEKAITTCEKACEEALVAARGDTWKTLRKEDPTVRQSSTNVYYIRAVFRNCSPQTLFDAIWKNNLKWNDQVLEGKSILAIDHTTELYYSVSAPAMRGYIASRDFLDVRRLRLDSVNQQFSGFFTSCESSILPANSDKKIVRGSNGNCMMRTSLTDTGGACLEWIMQTDLKGGLPKRLVQSSMLTFFVQNMEKLRSYIAQNRGGSTSHA